MTHINDITLTTPFGVIHVQRFKNVVRFFRVEPFGWQYNLYSANLDNPICDEAAKIRCALAEFKGTEVVEHLLFAFKLDYKAENQSDQI